MDRMEEYNTLLAELEKTPPALEHTLSRACARAEKSRKTHRLFAIPASSLAVFFAAFVVMVNLSAPFAYACGRVPLLRELAAAVAFSPSLSAAVENEYVQPIDQEQTVNGITMKIEYVIVDQKQLSIFYTLRSQSFFNVDAIPEIKGADGEKLEGYSIMSGGRNKPDGQIYRFTVDFTERDMPESLILSCKIRDYGGDDSERSAPAREALAGESEDTPEPEPVATFAFTLRFDPSFTQQGEMIGLNQEFVLGGQRLTADSIEIYPTHIRLNLKDHEENTAWLKSLDFYLEDERGNRFEAIGNGISATGSATSPMMVSHRLESSFFSKGKHLTLYITGAAFLDKDMERIRVDLKNKKADALPEGVTFGEAKREEKGWRLTFTAPRRKENACHQLFLSSYYDEEGKEYSIHSWLSGMTGRWDEEKQMYVESPGLFEEQFKLEDYPYDIVYLSPAYSYSANAESPVVVEVK